MSDSLTSANYQNLSFRRYFLTIEVQVKVYVTIVLKSRDWLLGCQICNYSDIFPGLDLLKPSSLLKILL